MGWEESKLEISVHMSSTSTIDGNDKRVATFAGGTDPDIAAVKLSPLSWAAERGGAIE